MFAARKKGREEGYGTVSNQSGSRGVQEAETLPGGSREREREERMRKRQNRMRERVETERKIAEKISHLEEKGDDERRMEQEEALRWRRGEKEVPLVRLEGPEGPQKTESPKVAKVLEKRERLQRDLCESRCQ